MIEQHESQIERRHASQGQPAQFRAAAPVVRSAPPRFHSLVWLIWLAAGVAAVTTNPLLNLLVMAQATLVALTCHSDNPVGRAFGLFVRLGIVLVLIRILLSAIPVGGISFGQTLLFRLPELQLPLWLGGVQLGGTATLEMIVGGLVGGVRLWAVILVFGAFNAVADHYGLLRRTPRFLFHAGLATTIALTFVPHVVVQLRAIRDAQRVRGHRFRTWRDALPLIVPLLASSLERSIQLAEALDSRGYGRTKTVQGSRVWQQVALVGGVTLLALGLYVAFTGAARGWLGVIAGGALLIAALHRMGSGTPRTRYVQEHWRRRDTLATLASVCVIVGTTLLRQVRGGGLLYTPLPRVTLPPFDPRVGALLLLLSVPAIVQMLIIEGAHGSQRLRHSTLADRS